MRKSSDGLNNTKGPFDLVGINLIGELVQSDHQNQYICVIIDYFTKWAHAYPLKTKAAAEVTKCILKYIYQFEVPKRVLIDQGEEFVDAVNTEVCKVLGISLCVPYHPQTNGSVERLHAKIQSALAKLVEDKLNTWDQHLDTVMFELRTTKQLTTQFSPFYLMFGREARRLSEIPEFYQVQCDVCDRWFHVEGDEKPDPMNTDYFAACTV